MRNFEDTSEAIFRSAARALRVAVERDPRSSGALSTMGTLTG
jgi:imidazoleglycerol phosphate dehydratase HisB